MNTVKWMMAGIATGVAAVTVKEFRRRLQVEPSLAGADGRATIEEPILGYDGMDQETLLEWLESADLEDSDVERIIRYEEANFGREPVLDALTELLA